MNFRDRTIDFFEKYIFGLLLVISGIGVVLLAFGGGGTPVWYAILGAGLIVWGFYLILSKRK